MNIPVRFFISLFFLCCAGPLHLFAQVYPKIEKLDITDHIFAQYSDDVSNARKALAAGKKNLPIYFYLYTAVKDDTVVRIAARCSIPYDALVTLNRIESVQTEIRGKTLILPTLPAVYLPDVPVSGIERLISALFKKSKTEPLKLTIYEDRKKRSVFCFPNEIFDGTVRAFFFKPFYRFPLEEGEGVLTSAFGERPDPFNGKKSYHPGIDLAAPKGSPVLACAAGKVREISYSKVYGQHIIIAHTDGRESLYGHLSEVHVVLNESVKSGKIIGAVGSTGLSTGPHLHFEIHEKGIPKNPVDFMEKRPKSR